MEKVSATKFRNNIFKYLDKIAEGENIVIIRNKKEIARLVPPKQINWRENMSIKIKLLTSPEDLIKPMEDIWEEYT